MVRVTHLLEAHVVTEGDWIGATEICQLCRIDFHAVQELAGTTPTANLLTGDIDEIFTRTDAAGTSGFLPDALGTTLALTSAAGAVQTSYTYEAFGASTSSGTASTNSFQYMARENDGNGLYFYRSRYYSPSFARFISEDPLEYKAGINLQSFVDDDPTDFTDPLGLKPKPPEQPKPCPPDTAIRDAQREGLRVFIRDMLFGEGGAFLIGCGIGAPAGTPFGGALGTFAGCLGGGSAAASAALPGVTFVAALDGSLEAYSKAFKQPDGGCQ